MENIIIAVAVILCIVVLWQYAIIQELKRRERRQRFDNISRTKSDDIEIRRFKQEACDYIDIEICKKIQCKKCPLYINDGKGRR